MGLPLLDDFNEIEDDEDFYGKPTLGKWIANTKARPSSELVEKARHAVDRALLRIWMRFAQRKDDNEAKESVGLKMRVLPLRGRPLTLLSGTRDFLYVRVRGAPDAEMERSSKPLMISG